jgi:hypothetical protein
MGGGSATAKTASYVLVAADAGGTVAMNAAGSTTITVNTGLFAAGDTVFIQNLGAGATTITAGTATVSTAGSLILPQYDAGILYFTATGASIFYDYIQAGGASPLTTKGDIYTYSTSDARLAVGTNTYVLTADSAEATGLKWAAPSGGGSAGLVLIGTTSFSAVSSVSPASAVFSSTYDNYLFRFNNVTTSTDCYIGMRMRVGGVDYSSTDYKIQQFAPSGSSAGYVRLTNLTGFLYVSYVNTTYSNATQFELYNPFKTNITSGYSITGAVSNGSIEGYANWWGLNTTTSYDSFTLITTAGTMTGSISVYGFAK